MITNGKKWNYLSAKSLSTIPHINSETNLSPPPPLSMLFLSICGSFLEQALVVLLFQYAATLKHEWRWGDGRGDGGEGS